MLTGLLTALVACLGYGVSSVLQAYGARRSAGRARARGATGQRTAAGAPTMASTIPAALTVWFVIGTGLDVLGFVGGAVADHHQREPDRHRRAGHRGARHSAGPP